jgi:hypothetical protein
MNQPIIGRRSVETLQSSDWYAMKISKEFYKECVVHHEYSNHPAKS